MNSKTLFTAIVFSFLFKTTTYSQSYIVRETMDIQLCDRDGNQLSDIIEKLQSGIKFTVERQKGNILIISIPRFKGSGDRAKSLNEKFAGADASYKAVLVQHYKEMAELEKSMRVDPDTSSSEALDITSLEKAVSLITDKYFSVDVDELKKKATRIFEDVSASGGFVFGPMIVPIKVRFGTSNTNFALTSDVNLGLAAGHKFAFLTKKSKPWELALLGGVSVTSISMDASTTKNFLTQENKIAGLTTSISGVFMKDGFQIGLMIGMDTPSGEIGKKWIYRDIPWIGFGLGVTLFNNNNKETRPISISN
jgi:hypothetical protein